MENSLISELFVSNYEPDDGCFSYEKCPNRDFEPCMETHSAYRYSDASAAWILISAIIVFFMKAGFLLIELAFAQNVREKRHVVVVKHLDVFASAFGFFLFGFYPISNYHHLKRDNNFTTISDPILWFFKFTFASNAATILGGCLVTNKYKLRLPAAFLSSFIISGIIHPLVARLIWSDVNNAPFSPYKFCNETMSNETKLDLCGNGASFIPDRIYILDFAGGGAVHLVGGVAGLILCMFAKWQKVFENKNNCLKRSNGTRSRETEKLGLVVREQSERPSERDFWEWMYPVDGGGETTSEAALGVLILWFCWFAFNCGSTESVESIFQQRTISNSYHAVPSVIAINMIMAAASGGVIAVVIASWAQIRSNSDSVNANEIANGVLSALVAITSGCPFVDYWAACIIGVIAVIVYHFGCWLEYKFGIEDTARVVPVHGLCGLWSMLAVGFFVVTDTALCNLHITFEGLCYCQLRLPKLNFGERLASQIIGTLLIITITATFTFVMYTILYVIPIKSRMTSETRFANRYNKVMQKFFKFTFKREDVHFEGNWLFTGPGEIPGNNISSSQLPPLTQQQVQSITNERKNLSSASYEPVPYGAVRETLGTVTIEREETTVSFELIPSEPNSTYNTETSRSQSARNRTNRERELKEPNRNTSTIAV